MKAPTVKQARNLMVLGGGAIALAPGRGEWGSLVRRGWVEPVKPDDKDKRFLPPVRITPDGLRALAAAIERYPEDLVPEIRPRDYEQLNEPPTVTRLKAELAAAKQERDEAQRRDQYARSTLARCRQSISQVLDVD